VVNVTVSGLAGTGTCDFTSTIQLILQTTSAHSYTFIFPNVGVGTYYLSVQAAADSSAVVNAGSGSAVGGAAYGLGSLTVESVRMVHNFSF
jgi:pantothenate kinase